MLEFPRICRSLSDLLALRSSLRQQETVLADALRDVQAELRFWREDRARRDALGRQTPRELVRIREDLAERERGLVLDLLQVRHSLSEVNGEVRNLLARRDAGGRGATAG
ncbi:MAG: hypothetical protein Fur0037_17540 [Planctomycetota bacterium]